MNSNNVFNSRNLIDSTRATQRSGVAQTLSAARITAASRTHTTPGSAVVVQQVNNLNDLEFQDDGFANYPDLTNLDGGDYDDDDDVDGASQSSGDIQLNEAPAPVSQVVTMRNDASDNNIGPDDWEGIFPDSVMKKLKTISSQFWGKNKKEFYKTFTQYNKMTADQRNKAIVWFRNLNPGTRGKESPNS
jgi:hypothetical protein